MSNIPERNKPEKSNPSQSKSRQGEDSKIRPNPNTLKFSDIPVNNEDSKSLETPFLPQQSSENFPRGFIGDKQSVPLFTPQNPSSDTMHSNFQGYQKAQ